MNELALFAGAGGGILGGKLLGWRTICAVEWEPYPASILCARQNEGFLPPFPIWDDVQTFDGRPWRGIAQVVSGGFPCQDISIAGKGDGLDGERSSMWNHMARVVSEVRPEYVFVENSPMLTSRGGTRVIGDLTKMGYHTAWTVMGAANVGAPHQRDRIWIVGKHSNPQRLGCQEGATQQGTVREQNSTDISGDLCETSSNEGKVSNTDGNRFQGSTNIQELEGKGRHQLQIEQSRDQGDMAHTDQARLQKWDRSAGPAWTLSSIEQSGWWDIEPNVGRVVNGVASRVDRIKALGNGQVPLCAATAFRILSQML